MKAAEALSDEALLRVRAQIADRCVAIMDMPEAERTAAGKKGEASPEQAGALSAIFVLQLDREVQRRGLERPDQALEAS